MSNIDRRRFLKACGAGAAAYLGLGLLPEEASAARTPIQYAFSPGFTRQERVILGQAMNHVGRHMTSDAVIRGIYSTATRYNIDPAYARNIALPVRADWWLACMQVQLQSYCRRNVMRIQVTPIYERNWVGARGDLGIMRTLDVTRRTGRMQGNFRVLVNRYAMERNREPISWAGAIAHELMHNLGHNHGNGEYGDHLQINAITAALMNVIVGRRTSLPTNDLPQLACGCGMGRPRHYGTRRAGEVLV